MEEYWNPMVPELSVSDFSKSLNFYCEILGFKVRSQRTKPDFAYIEFEQVQIMLEQVHDNGWVIGSLEEPFGRGVNFQIELSNIEPVYERLKLAGIHCSKNRKIHGMTLAIAFLGSESF